MYQNKSNYEFVTQNPCRHVGLNDVGNNTMFSDVLSSFIVKILIQKQVFRISKFKFKLLNKII